MNTHASTPAGAVPDAAAATPGAASARLYVTLVAIAVAVAFLWKYRIDGIFSCPGSGYGADQYLAYCQADMYGDYDHGAFWFDLEPAAVRGATNAAVLFLGNSRLQYALSTRVTADFFGSTGTPYYLLGFTHWENLQFVSPLLHKLEPRARVYVINVDEFFYTRESSPASEVLHVAGSLNRYRAKGRWQPLHRMLCGTVPALCENHAAIYRSRATGAWQLRGVESFKAAPVRDAAQEDAASWPDYIHLAREFVSRLPVERDCVVLTLVPYHGTKRAEANTIAESLGLPLVSPRVDGLTTFDGSHLAPSSAKRWSQAFFGAAGPAIRRCLQ